MSAVLKQSPVELVLSRLAGVRKAGAGYVARCPAHDDDRPSLSVTDGDDGRALVNCFAGCATEAIVAAIGLEVRDLFVSPEPPLTVVRPMPRKISATYDYRDEDNQLLFQTVRYQPKDFSQRRPGPDGKWIWHLQGARLVLFNLPALRSASPGELVVVCAGEKDALRAAALGFLATTNPLGEGPGKWRREYSETLAGRPIAIPVDNDATGRARAQAVAASLTEHGCAVRVIELPGVPEHGDFSDWADAGGTKDAFEAILAATPVWRAQDQDERAAPDEDDEPEWQAPVPLSAIGPLPVYESWRLPGVLRDFVDSLAESLQMPTDLPAMLAVRTTSAAIAGKVAIRLKDDWIEPTNDYSVGVIESGTRKTPAYKVATRPFYDREASLLEEFAAIKPQVEAKRSILEKTIKRLEESAAKADANEDFKRLSLEAQEKRTELEATKVPAPPRLIASDVTQEKLGQMLEENRERIAIFSPEGEFFGQMAGRYSDNSPRIEVMLAGYSSDPVRVDRVNRPPNLIRRPVITIAIVAQPASVAGLAGTQGLRERGGIARFEYYIPQSTVGHRDVDPPALSAGARRRYEAMIEAALDLPEPNRVDAKGRVIPYEIGLSDDARTRFRRFMQSVEQRLREGEDLADMRDWGSKYCGRIARLAAVLHAAQILGDNSQARPWEYELDVDTLGHAIAIGDGYLVPHARAAYDMMAASPTIGAAQRVLRWIQRFDGATFTRRDLHQSLRRSFSSDKLDEPLALLEQHGFIRSLNPLKGKGPGRPSDRYEINPLGRAQNPQNPQKDESLLSVDIDTRTQNPRNPRNEAFEEGEL